MNATACSERLDVALDRGILSRLQKVPIICDEATIKNGYVSRLHRHVGLEIAYCLSGEGAINIGELAGNTEIGRVFRQSTGHTPGEHRRRSRSTGPPPGVRFEQV